MGHTAEHKCLDCGKDFEAEHDGGFFFHLLRCDSCGKTKEVSFEEIEDLHTRYIKGLPGPYCVASSEHDDYVQQNVDVEPLSEKDYNNGVEKFAGVCKCGGSFLFDAPVRCPKCRSINIEEIRITIMYD